jgi:hypothetical protein
MSITNTQKDQINKMNVASQRASLGTVIQNLQTYVGASGSIAVTATHTNASMVTIETGLGSIKGWVLQPLKASGSPLGDPYVFNSSGSLKIMATSAVYGVSGSFSLTVGDIYNWIAW